MGEAARSEAARVIDRGARVKRGLQALGRFKVCQMNKTEAAYAALLEQQHAAGEVAWVKFEGMKFRLADNTFYTPDFAVMLEGGKLETLELKGYWQDGARAKIKIAADLYPIRIVAVRVRAKKEGGGWSVEVF